MGGGHFSLTTNFLPHAIKHYIAQLIYGGHHAFYDTALSEYTHKIVIRWAGSRVRKRDANTTHTDMLRLVWENNVLRAIGAKHRVVPRKWVRANGCDNRGIRVSQPLSGVAVQTPLHGFVHRAVPITWAEACSFVASAFTTGRERGPVLQREERARLLALTWKWMARCTAFRGGADRSFVPTDVVRFRGVERLPGCAPTALVAEVRAARNCKDMRERECFSRVHLESASRECISRVYLESVSRECISLEIHSRERFSRYTLEIFVNLQPPPPQIVAFLRLERFSSDFPAPAHLSFPGDASSGHITLVLVRWFSPHPDAMARDSLFRPVCPGPLGVNHCKWIRAVTTRPRRCINDARSWSRAQKVLGIRPTDLEVTRADLTHARYEFQQVEGIEQYVSMNPYQTWDPAARAWAPHVDAFLETVVIP